ncbi:MAG: hypothetical protein NVS9B8_03730 [Candidatus Limnocylindrales bacterium]
MKPIIQRNLTLGIVVALASACAPAAVATPGASGVMSTGAPGSPSMANSPSTSSAPSPLTIGVVIPFTESAVDNAYGVAQQRAADLYLKQHGGTIAGRTARLVYSDESVSGSLDLVKATQLVEQEHADVLLGLIGNEGAYAVGRYADSRHIVFIDTNASGNALTRAVPGCTPACLSPDVFRSSYSSWQLSEPLGEWAAQHGATTFDVLAADDTFGRESAQAFIDGLARHGGSATTQTAVPVGATWETVVAAIAARPTKHVYAAFVGPDAAGFITAWGRAHLSDKGYTLYGPGPLTELEVLKQVKAAAVRVTTASFWSSALDNQANRTLATAFAQAYQNENGAPLVADSYVVQMWDAMTALDLALQATNASPATDGLITALENVAFKSPRGDFSFAKATHNVVQDIYIQVVRASGGSVANAVVGTIPKVSDPGR